MCVYSIAIHGDRLSDDMCHLCVWGEGWGRSVGGGGVLANTSYKDVCGTRGLVFEPLWSKIGKRSVSFWADLTYISRIHILWRQN